MTDGPKGTGKRLKHGRQGHHGEGDDDSQCSF